MQDYEFAGTQRQISFRVARRVLVPDSIPVERLRRTGATGAKLIRYPGLKEEYYLADFEPDPEILAQLGVDPRRWWWSSARRRRPPPTTPATTSTGRSCDRLVKEPGVAAVVIPRTEAQRAALRRRSEPPTCSCPRPAIDAQSLIACADLVISAGGTMNREAVALGTPVFTTFTGRMGGVDEALIAAGRMAVLTDPSELAFAKRESADRRAPSTRPRAAARRSPRGRRVAWARPNPVRAPRYGRDI